MTWARVLLFLRSEYLYILQYLAEDILILVSGFILHEKPDEYLCIILWQILVCEPCNSILANHNS